MLKRWVALLLSLILSLSCVFALAEGGEEPVIVTVATWQNAILTEELLERFNAANPGIVAVTDELNAYWFDNAKLTERVAAGTMPDIVAINTPEYPVQNGWLLDLAPYLAADEDHNWYPASVQYYGGKAYALPVYMYFYGVIVNLTMLRDNNIEIPGYDWTIEDMIEIARATSKGKDFGLASADCMLYAAPAQMDANIGSNLINVNMKDYEFGDAFIKGVNYAKELRDANMTMDNVGAGLEGDDYTAYMMENYGVDAVWKYWLQGHVAMNFTLSWDLGIDNNEFYGGFDWDFYPFPTENKGDQSRTCIMADCAGIYAGTKNPDAAYKVLKWLTYSAEGYAEAVEIMANYDDAAMKAKYPQYTDDFFFNAMTPVYLPCCFSQEAIEGWTSLFDFKPGVVSCVAGIPYGYMDGYKCAPGWDQSQAILYDALQNEIYPGNKSAADIAVELDEKCTMALTEAWTAMGVAE